ncbi:MAG: 16S rRNA (uracil(1498)-N(3))-methyltransferase [Desulfomonilaceae bacterium]
MPRLRTIFVDKEDFKGDRIRLSDKNKNYLFNVLRMKSGDRVIFSDGRSSYFARLTGGADSGLGAIMEKQIESGDFLALDIMLVFGCVRPDPIEQILRHCTELGVRSFIPMLFERNTRKPQEKKQRWENIVAAACAQSGRLAPPIVYEPMFLKDFLSGLREECLRIFLDRYASNGLISVLDSSRSDHVIMLVGPEGGLTKNEAKLLEESQFVKVSLGNTILRTETASIAAVSVATCWAKEKMTLKKVENHEP